MEMKRDWIQVGRWTVDQESVEAVKVDNQRGPGGAEHLSVTLCLSGGGEVQLNERESAIYRAYRDQWMTVRDLGETYKAGS